MCKAALNLLGVGGLTHTKMDLDLQMTIIMELVVSGSWNYVISNK